MHILAIYNPVCGYGMAKPFFDDHVLPLLSMNDRSPHRVVGTEFSGHAGILLVDFLRTFPGDTTVVLGSGDGTLHEIINHLASSSSNTTRSAQVRLALVPCGTANALYSALFPPQFDGEENTVAYRLKSVQSLLRGLHVVPLALGVASFFSPHAESIPTSTVLSAVVISTAAHASILRNAEALRKDFPSMERFKIAARQNYNKWFSSHVRLIPARGAGVVEIYDPEKKVFVPHPESHVDDPIVTMDGPFAYFLATLNVDRLEPRFRITPLAMTLPPNEGSFDVVIVRPLRSPTIVCDSDEAKEKFALHVPTIFQAAYQNGLHVALNYDAEGKLTAERHGIPVVEYIRCGGWEWKPDATDEAAHIVCSDGAIHCIAAGGAVVAEVAGADRCGKIEVYM